MRHYGNCRCASCETLGTNTPRTVIVRDRLSGPVTIVLAALIVTAFAFVILYAADRATAADRTVGWRATATVCVARGHCLLLTSPLYPTRVVCEVAAAQATVDLGRRYPRYAVAASCHNAFHEYTA